MKRVVYWIQMGSCLFFCLQGLGQPVQHPFENAYIKDGAYSVHFTDAFSFRSNPACLAGINRFFAGLLAEKKWMLDELKQTSLAVCLPLVNGGLGISLQRSGGTDYNEQELELGYGENLGRLELGIRLGYQQNRASGYGITGFGSAGFGLRYKVSEKLITGWELGLPAFGNAGRSNSEKGPRVYRMGFGYELSTDLFLAAQLVKITGLPVNVAATIEYHYGEQFIFSFGFNSNTSSPYFKAGWKKNRLSFQIYTVYEMVLGFSPGMVLLWESKKKKG
jgi:hypothetical protein